MDMERLYQIIGSTTCQIRKGPEVQVETMGAMSVTTIDAMPSVSEAPEGLKHIDMEMLIVGVDEPKAQEHKAELIEIRAARIAGRAVRSRHPHASPTPGPLAGTLLDPPAFTPGLMPAHHEKNARKETSMASILNKKRSGVPAGAVYIGRPSKWGNPFVIGTDGTRDEVIAKYRTHLLRDARLMAALPELRGKDLVCWCAPCACHGDVLLELANRE